jgi:glycosyltransferase involved in cell wall biosynthesis
METSINSRTMEYICIVIPCYNEGGRIPAGEIISFLELNPTIQVCFVNDCSTDSTEMTLRQIREHFPERVLIENHKKNKGKAESVRTGVLSSLSYFQFKHIGYFDADLSTPLEECFRLKNSLTTRDTLEFSFGSRLAIIGSKIERKLYRHLFGRVIATFISNILGLKVYDTQCGAKLFTRELAEKVFTDPFISTWLFDVEIFARIIHLAGREKVEDIMIETPLMTWVDKGGSKIELSYAIRVFIDLYRIKRKYFPKPLLFSHT